MKKAQMYRLRQIVLELQQLDADKHEPELKPDIKSLRFQEMLRILNDNINKMKPISPMQRYRE